MKMALTLLSQFSNPEEHSLVLPLTEPVLYLKIQNPTTSDSTKNLKYIELKKILNLIEDNALARKKLNLYLN